MPLPTGPTIILEDMPPRSWSDVTVPEIPGGVDRDDFYAEWLADYLLKNPVPLSATQKEYVDSLPNDFRTCMEEYYPEGLVQRYDECVVALEIVQASHKAGESWEQFSDRQRKAWEHDQDGWDYENEWCCSRETWEAIGSEYREMFKVGPVPDNPDIPWRAYISLEINGMDKTSAMNVVKGYLSSPRS